MDLMMQMLNKKTIQDMFVRAAFLLTACGPMMAGAADKPPVPSPVGMASDVMNSGFLMQFVSGLAIVLVFIIVLAWMMRRFGRMQSSANGALRMIDGMALGTRERIVLVQVGNTQVLLGVAPGRVEAVHVLEEPVSETMKEKTTGVSFATRFKDALGVEQ